MLELDHLPFGVSKVEASRDDLRCLGFTPTDTGVCRWMLRGRAHRAAAASVVFERGYLDLVEIQSLAWEEHLRSSQVYRKGMAPSGVVLSSSSLEKSLAVLAAGGIAHDDPYEIVRELPGANPPQIHYEICSLRDRSLPFALIQDSAPAALRTQQWLRHPNSATGIHRFHLRVPSLRESEPRLALALGGGSAAGGAVEFDLGAAHLVIHEAPRDPYLEAFAALLPRRDRATLLAIEFAVTDLDATGTILARNQIPSLERAGGIAVEPGAGYACGVVFVTR